MRPGYLFISIGLLLFGSCSYDFPVEGSEQQLETGSANMDRFTVLGGAISAGMMDGALYKEGQDQAYPALLGAMLEKGLEQEIYSSLDVDSENGINFEAEDIFGAGAGRFELHFRNEKKDYPARIPTEGEPLENFGGALSEVANYSIPGLRITEIDSVEALIGNPYFDRLTSRQSNQSLLDIAIGREPTLLLLQVGNADLYNYYMAGARGEADPPADGIATDDLTPLPVFEQKLNEIITRILNETSAEVIVSTVPDPLKLPYGTTHPWHFTGEEIREVLRTKDLSFVDEFNIDVQEYNYRENGDRPIIVFDVDGDERSKGLVIVDEFLADATANDGTVIPKWRQLGFGDFLLYNAEKAHYESLESDFSFGTTLQIADRYALTVDEQAIVRERRSAFNEAIKAAVSGNPRLHLLDLASMIDRVGEEEVYFDGVTYTLDFGPAGIISADGYSLNPKGHALLANLLIKLLNEEFSARLPSIDVNAHRGTIIKNGF